MRKPGHHQISIKPCCIYIWVTASVYCMRRNIYFTTYLNAKKNMRHVTLTDPERLGSNRISWLSFPRDTSWPVALLLYRLLDCQAAVRADSAAASNSRKPAIETVRCGTRSVESKALYICNKVLQLDVIRYAHGGTKCSSLSDF